MKRMPNLILVLGVVFCSQAFAQMPGEPWSTSDNASKVRAESKVERREVGSSRLPDRGPSSSFIFSPLQAPVRHLWGDIDHDGLKDLFVLDLQGNLIFRNLGDGGFEDVTAKAFPDGAGKGGTGFWGDYNADDLCDLFLFQEQGFTLFKNEGKLHFTDVTETLGIQPGLQVMGAQLEDYDGDGYGDLLIQTPQGDRILRNRNGNEFGEVRIFAPSRNNTGLQGTTGSKGTRGGNFTGVSAGGSSTPGGGPETLSTFSDAYVNDNSPGSVGIGVPEVEGGDDTSKLNDIVDGTVTGEDLAVPLSLTGSTSAPTIQGNNDAAGGRGVLGSSTVSSGVTYGVLGENSSTEGRAVAGYATATTGGNYGVYGHTSSTGGHGVLGYAPAATGSAIGVKGVSFGESGKGVYGHAGATTGSNIGVFGQSESTEGRGVFGFATAATGDTHGVHGMSLSTNGKGVIGYALADSGVTCGVYGHSSSPEGRAVCGYAPAATGYNAGVYGHSLSENGTGVFGSASATVGQVFGVHGYTNSNEGIGVFGNAAADTGPNIGVFGKTNSPEGRAGYFHSTATSGETCGVVGESVSPNGFGVCGFANSMTGESKGIYGVTDSSEGYGVYGWASAPDGSTYGVYGKSDSVWGRGVYGEGGWIGVRGFSPALTGTNYGIWGEIHSEEGGCGVFGAAWAGTGNTYGVHGISQSSSGKGVYGSGNTGVYGYGNVNGIYGKSTDSKGTGVVGDSPWIGVQGNGTSTDGIGVVGDSPWIGVKGMGDLYGVVGESTEPYSEGFGVMGKAYAKYNSSGVLGEALGEGNNTVGVRGLGGEIGVEGTGEYYGVHGICHTSAGIGVYGYASNDYTLNDTFGVIGRSEGSEGIGVYGESPFYGVVGEASDPSNLGLAVSAWGHMRVTGDIWVLGDKHFMHPHPNDPSKVIAFTCLEGNESGTYFRGSTQLKGGRSVIEVPEEFRLVTEAEGLTVQVTPMGPAMVWVEEKGLREIIVRGDADVAFDYFVNGVRRGFTKHDTIQEFRPSKPMYRGEPYGREYPEAVRNFLVENETLNPDFTPNEKTAQRLGWLLRSPDEKPDRRSSKHEINREGQKVASVRQKIEDRRKRYNNDVKPPKPIRRDPINRNQSPNAQSQTK